MKNYIKSITYHHDVSSLSYYSKGSIRVIFDTLHKKYDPTAMSDKFEFNIVEFNHEIWIIHNDYKILRFRENICTSNHIDLAVLNALKPLLLEYYNIYPIQRQVEEMMVI